jgi:transglutaminase-like putative cysteine protease/tetratricopeptide (TPR) repeat protein
MRKVVSWSLVLALTAAAVSAEPLDQPAFSASPAELLAAAKAVPADAAVTVLRNDIAIAVDARGRVERRERLVFAIRQAVGADDWGTLRLGWRPFYQERPTVRGRVIGPDGAVTPFDLALIHDAPAVMESPQVFSDRRDLSVPLPRLVVGAVVEEEFVTTDREPLSAAGTVSWEGVSRDQPIARYTLTISHPTARPITLVTRGPSLPKPNRRQVGDRTELRWDLRGTAARTVAPPASPSDLVVNPLVGLTTGASWAAVAADYRGLVEAKLAEPIELPPELAGPRDRATVARIVAWLHAKVRYTGIELGDSAMIPAAPRETLARGFGDCKDKATLLIALLRRAGFTADVALLSTGPGWDVDPALPGQGGFDHAIVRVVVAGKDLWIDATEDLLPVGQLPVRDQGRRALIAGPGVRALVTTPSGGPADNLVREVRDYHLAELDGARVVETSTQTGVFADDLRGWVRRTARADLEDALRGYVDGEYSGRFVRLAHSDPDDVATPFSLTVEAEHSGLAFTERDQVGVYLSGYDALAKLPDTFTSDDDEIEAAIAERTVDYVWTAPHRYQIENRLHLPPGHTPQSLPPPEIRKLGTMTLTTTHARAGDLYTVKVELDTGKRRITADELRATRAAVQRFGKLDRLHLVIARDAARLLAGGQAAAAIAECQRLIALHPGEALHHSQLALTYLATGMGLRARRRHRRHQGRARRRRRLDDPRACAAPRRDRALEPPRRRSRRRRDRAAQGAGLESPPPGARLNLAELLAVDRTGVIAVDPARLREATDLRLGAKADGEADQDDVILTLLAFAGDAARLEELGPGMTGADSRRKAAVLSAALRGQSLEPALAGAPADVRSALATFASGALMVNRAYDRARLVGRSLQLPALERGVQDRLRPIDPRRIDASDPAMATGALFAAHGGAWPATNRPWSDEVERDRQLDPSSSSVAAWMRALPVEVRRDLLVASLTTTVTADGKRGWRVEATIFNVHLVFYVANRRGRAVVVGTNQEGAAIGRELAEAVARRDLAWARRLATWLTDDLGAMSKTEVGAFLTRHRGALATAPAATLELVAALILAERDPAWATPRLTSCAGLTERADRATCADRLATAHRAARRGPEAVAALEALGGLLDDSQVVPEAMASALVLANRVPDAIAALDRALAADPDLDRAITRAALVARTDRVAARAAVAAAIAKRPREPQIYNNAAWLQAYLGDPAAVATIEPVITKDASRNARNTYAVALAEAGEPYKAWQQVVTGVGDKTFEDSDWYALGRIAETYGLRDDALAYYRRILGQPGATLIPLAIDFAAQRRAILGAP